MHLKIHKRCFRNLAVSAVPTEVLRGFPQVGFEIRPEAELFMELEIASGVP